MTQLTLQDIERDLIDIADCYGKRDRVLALARRIAAQIETDKLRDGSMKPLTAFEDPAWEVASNGARKRHFGVARFAGREWAKNAAGNYRRFASAEAAQKVANKLNAGQA